MSINSSLKKALRRDVGRVARVARASPDTVEQRLLLPTSRAKVIVGEAASMLSHSWLRSYSDNLQLKRPRSMISISLESCELPANLMQISSVLKSKARLMLRRLCPPVPPDAGADLIKKLGVIHLLKISHTP